MDGSEHMQQTARRSPLRGNVLTLGLVSLFTDLSSEMMNPLLPIFITGLVPFGLAPVYVGLMEGVAETTASLLKLVSGHISDRLGKRKMLVVAGYGLSTVVRPLMALAGLVGPAWAGGQVVGLKFLDRVGKGVRTSPRDALISDSVGPEVRSLAFSFTRAMDHAGAVVHIGFLSTKIILSPDRKLRASKNPAVFRFPSAAVCFAA
jgi:MFS family permease